MHNRLFTLLFLVFISQTFSEEIYDLPYSAPDQIVALTQEPAKIGRIISPLSGQPCLRQTDLIAKGAQDVTLKRVFISQHRDWYANQALLISKGLLPRPQKVESGWVIFPHTRLDHLEITKRKYHQNKIIKNEVRIVDPNGVALTFALKQDGSAQLVDKPFGICNSNSSEEIPSGQYDLRNTKIVKNGKVIDVYSSQGSIYRYSYPSMNIFSDKNDHSQTQKGSYLLVKEILPNGKVLRYRYNKNKELIRVESLDPKERHIYACINIDSSPLQSTSQFSTNSGLSATYQQNSSRQVKKSLPKDTRAVSLLSITSVNTPLYPFETISFDKALLENYSGHRNLFSCHYAESGENQSKNKRVSTLLLPGDGAQLAPIYEFSYEPPLVGEKAGKTCVKNIDGSYVVYEYSAELLLTAIKYFDANSVLQKKKKFYWTDNHWLSSLTAHDGKGYLLYKKSYQYDSYGNPELEVFHGDVTGSGVYENITITRQFSNDGRHLLLKEKNDEGKTLIFQYLPNTNLISAKFTKGNNLILLREFYEYDDCNNLIRKIEDNGTTKDKKNLSGVTQRKITNYILRNQPPFLHLPEWIEEKYLENGSEKLLKKTHLAYDAHGNISEESVYDANNLLAYTLYKSYDDRGNLISESNAIGQQAVYGYDDKGRRVSSSNFSKTIQTKMEYDQRDRLIKIEEAGFDHIIHSTSFAYDLNDHLIRKIDPFQNATEYSYDPLCHKVTRRSTPSILGQEEKSFPVITASTYDSFGREVSKTDANGNTTLFRYNGHALPIEVIYADGSKESFTYTRTGLLESHIDREGLKASYRYDVLGRTVSKSFSTSEGKLAKETFVYDSFNLIEKTNREGTKTFTKTFYRYDGAGRLIDEEILGRIIHYSYDALGRILTIVNHNGKNSLYTHYTRDLLDHVLEKQCTDAEGKVLSKINYSYEPDGNISAITRNINGKEAIETFAYDSFQRQIEAIDAEGNQTKTVYNENHVNALGQRVLQVTTIDPKNKSVIKTEDPYGRMVQEDVVDQNNKLITSQKMIYDPNGNLLNKQNLIFQNGQYQRTLETQYSYTSGNKVSRLTRAANSSNSRTTLYNYTPGGKLKAKTKPDGTVLSYAYTPFGDLKSLSSNDNQLKLTYDYNLVGDLVKATDELNNISIQRNIDCHGNILSERLSTGLMIQKTYDDFDRSLSIDLPNQELIQYTYDPLFLRSVSRISPSGEVLYTHEYTNYDSSGYLQEENLIGSLGTVKHSIDLKGRKASITSPYFSESYCYENDNVIAITTNGNEVSYTYDELDQLTGNAKKSYLYDTNYNRIMENGVAWSSNELDELLSTGEAQCTYDLNGNLVSKKTATETMSFAYDPMDRLVRVVTNNYRIEMAYDPLGRRVNKKVYGMDDSNPTIENYLYDNENDIGAFTPEGTTLQLRILGLAHHKNAPSTVAIELEKQVFAPIQDIQGNIRYLISPNTGKKVSEYHFSAFGRQNFINESIFNPWRYASKRFDPETNLINFGKRYFDTELSRWISTDPAGFIDLMNLYNYVKNNPYRFIDPNGLFLFPLVLVPVIEISFSGIVSWISAEAVVGALVGAAIGVGVYQVNKALDADAQDVVINNEAAVEEEVKQNENKNKRKRHTNDQEALSDLVKGATNGVSNIDADTLLDWAKEYDFPARDDRGKPPHWVGGEHIHLGPKHIPIRS